jgi:hypothetical protein
VSAWTLLPSPLSAPLLAPLAATAARLASRAPRQALLCGLHNPFGRASGLCDPWQFLDVCESAEVVEGVARLIGPDVVLWESELYLDCGRLCAALPLEGRYWPADPLAGALADIALGSGRISVWDVRSPALELADASGAHYVIRYMPASSLYNRDPLFPPNVRAMEERPLVNYLDRPLWLVRGEDRAGNDYAAGFQTPAPAWAADSNLPKTEV